MNLSKSSCLCVRLDDNVIYGVTSEQEDDVKDRRWWREHPRARLRKRRVSDVMVDSSTVEIRSKLCVRASAKSDLLIDVIPVVLWNMKIKWYITKLEMWNAEKSALHWQSRFMWNQTLHNTVRTYDRQGPGWKIDFSLKMCSRSEVGRGPVVMNTECRSLSQISRVATCVTGENGRKLR